MLTILKCSKAGEKRIYETFERIKCEARPKIILFSTMFYKQSGQEKLTRDNCKLEKCQRDDDAWETRKENALIKVSSLDFF